MRMRLRCVNWNCFGHRRGAFHSPQRAELVPAQRSAAQCSDSLEGNEKAHRAHEQENITQRSRNKHCQILGDMQRRVQVSDCL